MFVVPLLIAFLGGLLGSMEKLLDNNPKKRIIGIASILILLTGLGWEGYNTYKKGKDIERLELFTHSNLQQIDEASGGTIDSQRGVAYVVDDDEAEVFIFKFNEVHGKYEKNGRFQLWSNTTTTPFTNDTLEDLEGAAFYHNKLYLVTGHSNKHSGGERPKRQMFLEISLEEEEKGHVLRSQNLRESILETFDQPIPGRGSTPLVGTYINEEERREVMNIEGLAIDPQGRAYFGFRNPLVDGNFALVLRANIQRIFEGNHEYEVILLTLEHKGKSYGITAMEIDQNGTQILILGNSRSRHKFFSPALWRWPIGDNEGVQQVYLSKADVFQPPENFKAKPEVLLVPQADRIGMFADADGYGGQLTLKRSELGL